MAQQTAVEWLIKEINDRTLFSITKWEYLKNKAKEMEKEQMIEFFMKGQSTYPSEFVLDNKQIAEQYYNETYNI